MDPCIEKHRIERLESDIKELKEADKKHTEDITELKEGQAESRLFQKLILEQLAEIKAMIAHRKGEGTNQPPSINDKLIDLAKYVIGGTILVIVGWMVGSNLKIGG